MGDLPPALEQAAAYLIENPWRSLADYAQLLRIRMAELLREGKREEGQLPVASTWDLSFQRVQQAQPAAADLLRLCACMDDIPITVLRAAASEIDGDRALGRCPATRCCGARTTVCAYIDWCSGWSESRWRPGSGSAGWPLPFGC